MAAKVKINPSPTDELLDDALNEVTVTDKRGRVITLKKPGVLAQYRVVKIVGGEAAQNQVYMGMVMPLLFITDIDGDPVPFPQTEREIEALIQLLDEAGLEAVMKKVTETWGEIDPEATKDAIRK